MAPAVILLLLAPLWVLFDAFQIYQAITFKLEDAVRALDMFGISGELREEMEKKLRAEAEPEAVRAKVIFLSVLCALSAIVFLGALQMIRLRMGAYWRAASSPSFTMTIVVAFLSTWSRASSP